MKDQPSEKNTLQYLPGMCERTEKETDNLNRRSFVKIMGASMAMTYLAACRRPVEEIVPYIEAPEYQVSGVPEQFATSTPLGLSSYGLLVTAVEGRPTKIEGNPNHPATLGGTNAFLQASILDLYDPDRSKYMLENGNKRSWDDFIAYWKEQKEKLDESQGEGMAVLSQSFSSPTFYRLKQAFQKQYPKAFWAVYDPVSDENIYKGIKTAAGMALRPEYKYDEAQIILSLDSDFLNLESENVRAAQGFANGRKVNKPDDDMNRLYVVECGFSITGAMADHRMKLQSGRIGAFAAALLREIENKGINTGIGNDLKVEEPEQFDSKWLSVLVDDLIKHRNNCLIVAGRRQPPIVHALAAVLNNALGNVGKTLLYHELKDSGVSDINSLIELSDLISSDSVSNLIILGGNPVHNAPVDLNFEKLLDKIPETIHVGYYYNDTAQKSKWHIPTVHYLEEWGDVRNADGSLSVIQPLIAPLYDGKGLSEFIDAVATGEPLPAHDLVRNTWSKLLNQMDATKQWREVLHEGLFKNSRLPHLDPGINHRSLQKYLSANPIKSHNPDFNKLEVVFAADNKVFDGRFANNGWLQELPDPITKINWDNAASMSPKTAAELGFKNNDMARFHFQGRQITMPVWTVPGQADYSVVLPLGYGQKKLGRIADGAGFNVYGLRTSDHLDFGIGLSAKLSGYTYPISTSQNHPDMEERPLIREAALAEYRKQPDFAAETVHVPALQSLWEEHKYDEGYQWGMAIDLNLCIGCNACVIACQSENNIPIVGKRPSGYGREMHWLRIDRYFTDDGNPRMRFQPVACQHCEMAPCESVCPVAATSHDEEGLNVMVYNRCIGTRYCSNNCPYKVRRFNFYNYTKDYPEIIKMTQNPEVTVRSRGVMEKCSYCLQRINRAKAYANLESRKVEDGEAATACQQACPTGAIVFGNLMDKDSKVATAKQDRNYEILAEFNTRPRTSYQGKIRNPNPELG